MPSGPSRPQIDPQASFRECVEALKVEDYKKAEKKCGEVLSVAPKNPEANYYMGLAKVGRQKDKQAVKYFSRAIKERDNFVEAREQLALTSLRLGDRPEAEAQKTALAAILAACTPESCDTAYTDRCAKAIAKVDAALAAPPPTPAAEDAGGESDGEESSALEANRDFAWLLLQPEADGMGDYRDAVRAINEARYEAAIARLYAAQSAIGPHPDILNYLGFANRKLARLDAAKDYYHQALALDPDHRGANEYLGELHLEVGDIEAAKKRLARLDSICAFGCAEREDLARLIAIAESARSAAK